MTTTYSYKVVPAPRRTQKSKTAKTTEDRFAVAFEEALNIWGAQGWEYLRTDTLPVEERQGLTGKATSYQNMLVFRRIHTPVVPSVEPTLPGVVAVAPPAVEAPPTLGTPHLTAVETAAETAAPKIEPVDAELPPAPPTPPAAPAETR